MTTHVRFVLASVALVWGVSLMAKEVEFVPTVANANGSYSLTNAQNWVGGVVPGVNDVQVFKPTGTLVLSVEKKTSGYHQFAGMKFLSGSTFVREGTYMYANAPETEFYVAEGASVSCTNVIDTWNASYRIVKTGSGTFACKTLGADKAIKAIEAREGTLKVWNSAHTSSVRIFDGATFWAATYNFFRTVNPDVQRRQGRQVPRAGRFGQCQCRVPHGRG